MMTSEDAVVVVTIINNVFSICDEITEKERSRLLLIIVKNIPLISL